jgi:hypothetical protein
MAFLLQQFRAPNSELFGATVIDQQCKGLVKHWANRRLESYRLKFEDDDQDSEIQDTSVSNGAIAMLSWFDRQISDRRLDQQRQSMIKTTLRTSQCRPVFQ